MRIFEIWPNLQKFNLYITFPEYLMHTKWSIFVGTGFYESVFDWICYCFFERQIVYSIRNPWRINKTVIMWYFFSKAHFFKACASKVERICISPPLPFRLPNACQPTEWHMAHNRHSQPPTSLFAEPTVHIELNHTSCQRLLIMLYPLV